MAFYVIEWEGVEHAIMISNRKTVHKDAKNYGPFKTRPAAKAWVAKNFGKVWAIGL
jgi:hypothetical protein